VRFCCDAVLNNTLKLKTFYQNAALAHNLNRKQQASRHRRPLAAIQDGFPQQRG
jgi:hypothetical protein